MTLIAIAVILALLAGGLYAAVRFNEEKKAEQIKLEQRIRQRYDAAMQYQAHVKDRWKVS